MIILLNNNSKIKLKKLLENPHIKANVLSGLANCYKIKLRDSGYRLVYEVEDSAIIIYVISVGKRDKNTAYKEAKKRLD